MCAEMGKNVGAFPRKYAKADMVHVAPLSAGTRSALLPEFSVHGNEVDETSAHPQLIKSDSRLMIFETRTQHVQIGRASCRERVCQYGYISVVEERIKKK